MVLEARHLIGSVASAMIVDYERGDASRGTWHSRTLHYFDMTLTRRPKGALGRFVETPDEVRSVGPILFAPAGYHYAGQGGPGRQKSLAVVIEPARLIIDSEIDDAIATGLPHCISLEGESLRGLLRRIEREVLAPGFASALLLDGLCLSLLVETARAIRAAEQKSLRKGGLSARNLRLIEERVRCDDAAPTLSELAALCRLSQRHLVRAFQAETGRTVGDYVQQIRLERAQALLSETNLPISEIAGLVGFSSSAAFSTAFRRLCGQAPLSYRMQGRRSEVTT
jgi:AraC family transcriptional regulator